MDEKIKKLFTPFNIGKEKIKNRFVVAPMGVPAMSTATVHLLKEACNTS